MSDNWVVQNLQNALDTWNGKLAEIWTLLTQSPETFKGGAIWQVILSIHGALQAIGYALLVLFFVVGIIKTCGSFTEVKKPEHVLKLFVRFALAKGVITYGLELLLKLMMACRVSLRVRPGVVSVAMMLTTVMTMGRALTPQSRPSGCERSGIIRQGWPCSWVSPRIM